MRGGSAIHASEEMKSAMRAGVKRMAMGTDSPPRSIVMMEIPR